MKNRLIGQALLEQGRTQVGLKHRGIWQRIHCRLAMSDCFIDQSFSEKELAKVVVRYLVVCRHSKRVFPQRLALAPIRGLNPCTPTQEGNHGCRCRG